MCTDIEYREKIKLYCDVVHELNKLDKMKKDLANFIITENDKRNESIADPALHDIFDGQKIITSRLQENATKAGKDYLKSVFDHDIDKYINVTLSRFPNTAALRKIV